MAIISSGIWDIDPTVTDGTQLANYLNELVKAINTNQSSATRPPMIKKGGLWTKTLGSSEIAVMVYDGAKDYQLESIWTEVSGEAVYNGVVKIGNAIYTDGSLSIQSGVSMPLTLRQGTEAVLRFNPSGNGTFSESTSFDKAITVNGSAYLKGATDQATVPNMTLNSDGRVYRSTTVMYSAEEVDKKLAIKNKIIESLANKLDKLEDILIAKGDLKEKIALNVKDLIAEGEAEFQVYKTKLDEEAKKLQEKVEKAEQEAREKVVAKKKKK